MNYKIGVIPGDGIGPEIVEEARRVLDTAAEKYGFSLEYTELLMGGASIDVHGIPLTDETIAEAKAKDAVLMGSIGGDAKTSPWYQLPPEKRPEAGLLKLRKSLNLFANLRPAYLYEELKAACPLRDEIIGDGFDMLIMRELTGGLYFGARRTVVENGVREATDTLVYNENEIQIHFSDEDDASKKGVFSFGKKEAREEQIEKPTKAKAEKEKGGFFSRFGIGKKKPSADSRVAENENTRAKGAGFHREEINEQIYEMRRRPDEEDVDSETIIGSAQNNQPSLTYIGNMSNMPARIEVSIGPDSNEGLNERESVKRFTIGRFDINVGRRQSDFEFAENTRGVSRHHAIIERRGRTYSITDLNSSAGTVVNGIILRANQTAELTNNCHVSFGYDGADYVWRE